MKASLSLAWASTDFFGSANQVSATLPRVRTTSLTSSGGSAGGAVSASGVVTGFM